MIFHCMLCGKELVIRNIHSTHLFCSKRCNNKAQRLYTVEQRREELARRKKLSADEEMEKITSEIGDVICNENGGIIVKCVICGKDMVQRTASAKLYCSRECHNEQKRTHKISVQTLNLELSKRKAAYYAVLTPERKAALAYGKRKRGEFYEREKARLECGKKPMPTRHCHNFYTAVKCPNMTWDYYCPDCRRKKRMAYLETEAEQEETESIWDDFAVPSEPL